IRFGQDLRLLLLSKLRKNSATNARLVMNTIPSIFNARQINRTVLGGTEHPDKVTMPVSCVVLSRCGNQYRSRVFENLVESGFEKIISREKQSASCNTDQL